jgi:hypothetical protein
MSLCSFQLSTFRRHRDVSVDNGGVLGVVSMVLIQPIAVRPASLYLCQRRLDRRQPERHVHGAI